MPPAQAHQAENCFSAASRASIILTRQSLHQPASAGGLITDLKVSNRSAVPGNNSPIKEQISIANEIRLGYGKTLP